MRIPPELLIQQMDRDEFIARKNSFDLSEEFRQKLHSYVEYHKDFLAEEDSDFRHVILFVHEGAQGAAFHYFHFKPATGRCELFGLFVEPRYRSKGLGTVLLARALELSVGFGATFISVSFTEKGAREGKLARNFFHETQKYHPSVKFRVIANGQYF